MATSTQQSIPIAGIKDGIIILKNGSYRMILEVSAINFALKNEQEQNSLVFQYQSFLNSLHFPIEIIVRSKRLDLSPYLTRIRESSEKSLNELIKMQIQDYVDFVAKLITLANIMKKSFYVVVPYDPIGIKKLNIFDSLFAKTVNFDHLKIPDTEFKSATVQLQERGGIVASGLASMGLHCFQLSTEEIIEVFYQIYNPEESGKERVTDATTISSDIVVAKDESNNLEPDKKNNFERGLDNASLVEEQQKQAAHNRRQEEAVENQTQDKTAEPPKTQPVQNQAETQAPSLTITGQNNGQNDPASNQASPEPNKNALTSQNNEQ